MGSISVFGRGGSLILVVGYASCDWAARVESSEVSGESIGCCVTFLEACCSFQTNFVLILIFQQQLHELKNR